MLYSAFGWSCCPTTAGQEEMFLITLVGLFSSMTPLEVMQNWADASSQRLFHTIQEMGLGCGIRSRSQSCFPGQTMFIRTAFRYSGTLPPTHPPRNLPQNSVSARFIWHRTPADCHCRVWMAGCSLCRLVYLHAPSRVTLEEALRDLHWPSAILGLRCKVKPHTDVCFCFILIV